MSAHIETALWSLVSIAIGSLVTWLVARTYYVSAARDLETETKQIRNLLRIALQAMETAGMVKLNRDASGEPVGMIHAVAVSDSLTFSGELSAEIKKPEHPKGA
jgi:hypothetical protein